MCTDPSVGGTPSGTPSPSHKPTPNPRSKRPFKNPPPIRVDELEVYIQKKRAAGEDGFLADYKVNRWWARIVCMPIMYVDGNRGYLST